MSFAYPEFLFALAAISVPIIIHLFNFRRFKKVYFSDIRFLKDVEIETKSRNKLKNLLILASRMLAVAFLVMAFARPFVSTNPEKSAANTNSVVVYVDNSFSMNAEGEAGNLLEEAKKKAIEIGSAYKNGSNLHLLTNDFEPKHVRNLSFEEFKNEVTAIQVSPQHRNINNIVSRADGIFEQETEKQLYYISDAQVSSSSPESSLSDSLLSVYLVPVQANIRANLFIDSCWFSSPSRLPSQADMIHVRIRNSGTDDVESVSVKLTLNGVQRAVGNTSVAANSFEETELSFTNPENGIQLAEVAIQDYPITYDDKYYLSYSVAEKVEILSVNGKGASPAVTKLLSSDAGFNLSEVQDGNLDYSRLETTDLLVINGIGKVSSGMTQEVMNFVGSGGTVLFIPAAKPDLNSLNELMLALGAERFSGIDSSKLKVEGVNLQSDIYKNVFTEWQDRIDLPNVNYHIATTSSVKLSSERLITLANGHSLLNSYRFKEGTTYVLSTNLATEWTNLARHALFVPTIYNIALNSVKNGVSAEMIGSNDMIAVKNKPADNEVLKVSKIGSNKSFVPENIASASGFGIAVHGQVSEHGQYFLNADNGDTIQPLSFNYNRIESSMEFFTPEEFKEALNSAGINNLSIIDGPSDTLANQVQELQNGKQFWRLFLLIALACLLFETILIRIL